MDKFLSPLESMFSSLDIFGNINQEYMENITNLPWDEIRTTLKDELFYNPITKKYEERDRALTGNVRRKIQDVTELINQGLPHDIENEASHTLDALKNSCPVTLPFNDINVPIGSRWVPLKYYKKFVNDNNTGRFGVSKLVYSPVNDDLIADVYVSHNDWYMPGYMSSEVLSWALKRRVPQFTEEVYDPARREFKWKYGYSLPSKRTPDEAKRMRAWEAVNVIEQDWIKWLNRKDNQIIRDSIEEIYNDLFNCEIRPKYDGSFQTFPDLDLEKLGIHDLYPSQKDAIWMIKQNNGGVCWHQVGSGKTLVMCVAAYELKRIGICKKPVIICMKANVGQIADTFRKAYPNARILYPSSKEWSKANRPAAILRLCEEDWDCIILTHEQFCQLPTAICSEVDLLSQEIKSIENTILQCKTEHISGTSLKSSIKSIKSLEKILDNKNQNLKKLLDQRFANGLDFSDTKIDHIFVDEYHCFKNLTFGTKNSGTSGVGSPEGSKKAWFLYTAIRDIQRRKQSDLCATFASGTIITNSLTELYVLFKYLRPRALEKQNIFSFDAWATIFCEKKFDFELDIVGQLKSKERFASFLNLPELSQFLSQITDYRTTRMCGIEVPNKIEHFDSAPPTDNQKDFFDNLLNFLDTKNWHDLQIKKDKPENVSHSIMLLATNLARQASLDPRCLDNCQTYKDEPGNKVRRCAENIARIYHDHEDNLGTQFVFTDLSTLDASKWNIQQELEDILVREYHIPASQVQQINEATTDSKRVDLFNRMNNGEVRVLIGSTTRLGTGVNAQKRAVAVHHLDIPWRPSDVEQRNGRAIRNGNDVGIWGNNEVEVYFYATERSLDAYKFNLLKNKQMFIEQLNKGTIGVRRIDDDLYGDDNKAVSYAEFLAILSGNKDLLVKARLDAEILLMEKNRAQFYKERNSALSLIQKNNADIALKSQWLSAAKRDLAFAHNISPDTLPIFSFADTECSDMHSVGKFVFKLIDSFTETEFTHIGKYGCFEICARRISTSKNTTGLLQVCLVGESGQLYIYPENNGQPLRNSFDTAARFAYDTFTNLSLLIESEESYIQKANIEIERLSLMSKSEWSGTHKLQNLYEELSAVVKRIKEFNEANKLK